MLVPSLREHTRPKPLTVELDVIALTLLQMLASVTDTIVATHSYDQMLGYKGQRSENFTVMTICRGAGDPQNLNWPNVVVFPPPL
jgi:hypothetical protein